MTFTYTPPSSLADPTLTPVQVVLTWAASQALNTATSVLLMHFDGNFNDSSAVGNAITVVGATLSAASPKFGIDCCSFTSNTSPSTQVVRTPIVQNGPLDLLSGTKDFTVEGWVRYDSGAASFPAIDYGDDQSTFSFSAGFCINVSPLGVGGTLNISVLTTVVDSVTSTPWATISVTNIPGTAVGSWVHVALVRTSGVMSFFINGIKQLGWGAPTWANYTFPATSYCAFGRTAAISGGQGLGSVDEWMVSNVARYSADFTPPTSPFTNPGAPPGYIVYRDGAELAQVLTFGSTTYTDAEVAAGVTYTYTVAAQDGTDTAVSDLSSPLVVNVPLFPQNIYGLFVAADNYAPILLSNVHGIKPRIYTPIQSNTVSTKQ